MRMLQHDRSNLMGAARTCGLRTFETSRFGGEAASASREASGIRRRTGVSLRIAEVVIRPIPDSSVGADDLPPCAIRIPSLVRHLVPEPTRCTIRDEQKNTAAARFDYA
jgi:hypothetical protein